MSTIGRSNELNRIKWIERTLKKIPKGLKILDAGAGECQFKKYCLHLKYTSQDFAKYDGLGDGRGFQTVKWDNSKIDIVSDICSIPQKNSSYDAVLCTEVFEHIPDPISALNEFTRLIKKNGFLIITAPFCSLSHFTPFHFYSGFSTYFYKYHLSRLGFEILDLQVNGNYYEYLAQEIIRLPEVSRIYSRTKFNLLEILLRKLYLIYLQNLSIQKNHTKEILYFGCHVFARKIK